MEGPYESANQQGRLRARIAEFTKPPTETKVEGKVAKYSTLHFDY
jgi:hypothetical protein